MSLTDEEKISLLRSGLHSLRQHLATQPLRQHVDELLQLTDDDRYQRLLHPAERAGRGG